MLLADDFFFASHNDMTGRSLLSEGTTGLGTAAALLGELVVSGRIVIGGGQLKIRDNRPPGDPLAHTVLEELCRNTDVTAIRDWLIYLGRDAVEQVGQRLRRAGHVRATPVRRLLRSAGVVYVPIDISTAAWPTARLATNLAKQVPLAPVDIALAGLLVSTGLDGYLLRDAPGTAGRFLRELLATLPPTMRELLIETDAAVGDAVLSHRR